MTAEAPFPLSLNEIEVLAGKAARGAGAPWGIAEDIARAVRWRAERGLAWDIPLLDLLTVGPADRFGKVLALADSLAGLTQGATIAIEAIDLVWAPAILSSALYGRASGLMLIAAGSSMSFGTDGQASSDSPWSDLPSHAAGTLRMVRSPLPLPYELDRATARRVVQPHLRAAFEALAMRTTVPESSRSRATGAGGGTVDDD